MVTPTAQSIEVHHTMKRHRVKHEEQRVTQVAKIKQKKKKEPYFGSEKSFDVILAINVEIIINLCYYCYFFCVESQS